MAGSYDVDLLVVGGGPAGLAAALHARRAGMSVLVAEPRQAPVDKACGEGLMPGGLTRLSALGIDPAGVPLAGIAYLDQAGRRSDALFTAGPGRGVRRTVLHAALAAAADAAGVDRSADRVSELRQDTTGVEAAGVRARWLIAADGLHSPLRHLLGLHAGAGSPPRYGLRRHYAIAPWSDRVEVWWSEHGEAYVTPVAPNLVGVALLHRRRSSVGGDRLLDGFPTLARRLAGAEAGPVRGAGPLRQRVKARVAGRVLLVGDAAGYEDALTGEGISLALAQAQAAVAALSADEPARYAADWRRITRAYRWLTRGLVLTTAHQAGRRLIVPAAAALPAVFRATVNVLAR